MAYYTIISPPPVPAFMPFRFRFVPIQPRIVLRVPPPNLRRIVFYNDKIEVTVAKKAIHVQQWIHRIWRLYGNNMTLMQAVGLDTEWRPNLCPGEDHPIAIVQLCIGRHCLIFQLLHADGIPRALHAFLLDPRFTFCGVGIQDDVKKLYDHHGLRMGKTVDLNDLYKLKMSDCGYTVGLKRMVSIVLKKEMKKPKEVTLSAWDSITLDVDQIEYAAIDALVSSQLALALSASSKS